MRIVNMEMNNRHLKPKPGSYFNVTANNLQSPMFKGSISFKQSQWFHSHHPQAVAAPTTATSITTNAAAPNQTSNSNNNGSNNNGSSQQQQQQSATVHGTGNGTEDTRANIVAL